MIELINNHPCITAYVVLALAGIIAGMAAPLFVQPPDLLIDGQGRLLAVRTETGSVAFSSLRRARFNRDMWLRRMGQDRARGGHAGKDSRQTQISPPMAP